MTLVLSIALMFSIFCVLALLFGAWLIRRTPVERRLLDLVQSSRRDVRIISRKEKVEEKLLAIAKVLRMRLGIVEDQDLAHRLSGAGHGGARALDIYLAARFLSPLSGAILGSFAPSHTFFWIMTCAAVGYLLPDFWLRKRTKGRRERIRKSIPDAVDLLVICVDAGLGLDQALLRVGQELIISHPDINQEFVQINLEQRAGKPRLEAWQSMAERTQLQEFSDFVTMLTQTDRFGTPIVRALSRYAEELRMKRRQRAEELAAKTKIKILFPLVLFIFPCIFIVLLAPAVLSIAKSIGAFK